MNTILFAEPGGLSPSDAEISGPDRVFELAGVGRCLRLILPQGGTVDYRSVAGMETEGRISIFDLVKALSRHDASGAHDLQEILANVHGPCLVSCET